jgi:repressor LexA
LLFDKICDKCREIGISVAKLEKDAGLGNATIRGWKKSAPTVDNLKRVAAILGCTVDELLEE